MAPNLESDEVTQNVGSSRDAIIWRLRDLEAGQNNLEAGQRSHAETLHRIEKSLGAYRAVWKFAVLVGSGVAAVLSLLVRMYGNP